MELINGVPRFQKKVISKDLDWHHEDLSDEACVFIEIISLIYNDEFKPSIEMILELKQYKEKSETYLMELMNITIENKLIDLMIKKVENEIKFIDEILKGAKAEI